MIKNIEVEFKPSAEEMANELWQMDCEEQASFLYEVARVLRKSPSLFLTQLQYIANKINDPADAYYKASIVMMLENVLDYIKEEGDES